MNIQAAKETAKFFLTAVAVSLAAIGTIYLVPLEYLGLGIAVALLIGLIKITYDRKVYELEYENKLKETLDTIRS